jgi:site-specific DNA recombinase
LKRKLLLKDLKTVRLREKDRVRSLAEVARLEGIARGYVERLARLAFVAPAIVEAICQGQQPAELSAETLLNRINLPLDWAQQEHALGIK